MFKVDATAVDGNVRGHIISRYASVARRTHTRSLSLSIVQDHYRDVVRLFCGRLCVLQFFFSVIKLVCLPVCCTEKDLFIYIYIYFFYKLLWR